MEFLLLGLLLAAVLVGLRRWKNQTKARKTPQAKEVNMINSSTVSEGGEKEGRTESSIQAGFGNIPINAHISGEIHIGGSQSIIAPVPKSPSMMAATITAFLTPYLMKRDEHIDEEAAKKLWEAIHKKLSEQGLATVASEFAAQAGDPDYQLVFEYHLMNALKQDLPFAKEVTALLEHAQPGSSTITMNIASEVSHGSVVNIGKKDYDFAERLAGDESTDAPPPDKKKKPKGK